MFEPRHQTVGHTVSIGGLVALLILTACNPFSSESSTGDTTVEELPAYPEESERCQEAREWAAGGYQEGGTADQRSTFNQLSSLDFLNRVAPELGADNSEMVELFPTAVFDQDEQIRLAELVSDLDAHLLEICGVAPYSAQVYVISSSDFIESGNSIDLDAFPCFRKVGRIPQDPQALAPFQPIDCETEELVLLTASGQWEPVE